MSEEQSNCYISDHVLSQNISEEIEIKEDITSGRNSSQIPGVNIDDDNTIPDLRINRQKSRESLILINRDANESGSPNRPDDRNKILPQSRQKKTKELESSKYIHNLEESKEEQKSSQISEQIVEEQPFVIAKQKKKTRISNGKGRNSKTNEISSQDSVILN